MSPERRRPSSCFASQWPRLCKLETLRDWKGNCTVGKKKTASTFLHPPKNQSGPQILSARAVRNQCAFFFLRLQMGQSEIIKHVNHPKTCRSEAGQPGVGVHVMMVLQELVDAGDVWGAAGFRWAQLTSLWTSQTPNLNVQLSKLGKFEIFLHFFTWNGSNY